MALFAASRYKTCAYLKLRLLAESVEIKGNRKLRLVVSPAGESAQRLQEHTGGTVVGDCDDDDGRLRGHGPQDVHRNVRRRSLRPRGCPDHSTSGSGHRFELPHVLLPHSGERVLHSLRLQIANAIRMSSTRRSQSSASAGEVANPPRFSHLRRLPASKCPIVFAEAFSYFLLIEDIVPYISAASRFRIFRAIPNARYCSTRIGCRISFKNLLFPLWINPV